ncbi:MAG: phosphate signaling complex protein PhoU [Lachnospiraceae bacterium]|jgi:phosphate transport system protein|nr:phosphate signaling complex protein PhoU [Lachnospiraceae bacterium]MDD3616548.1 phosphate signaling complex protein PhoU [Lachnospiraceae bacterium]
MRNHFEEQLEKLNVELMEMGALCEQAIENTYKILDNADIEMIKDTRKKEALIDHKEREIENLCFELLLRQQPVARDLRQVSAALKMVTDMERIGDQASDIAEIVETVGALENSVAQPLEDMANHTIKMVKGSVNAYVKADLDLSKEVQKYDDVIDQNFVDIRKNLIDVIVKNPENGELAMDLLMIAKYYERIGDHACNIAEWVEFSITGQQKEEDE